MNKKPKIIHLITRLDSGGSAENTFLTAREFRRRGYETAIWAGTGYDLPREIEREAAEAGVPLRFVSSLVRSLHPVKDFVTFLRLVRLLRREKPDILHTHTSKAGFLGRAAGRVARVPVILHTPHGHIFYGYFGPLKTKFYIWLERLAACWTDAIIPLTSIEGEEHYAVGIGKKGQYIPIASGVDFSKLSFSPELRREMRGRFSIPDAATVIGSVGRFVPIKGFDLVVEAAPSVIENFPSAYFYLGGAGPLKEKLMERVRQLGLEKKFLFDDFQEVRRPLHLLDIFLLPSRNEGQSRTLVEAMALKKGVVASAVGGVPEVISNRRTGLLVASGNPEALAQGIEELLRDPEKMKQMGEAAAADVRKRFSLEEMIRRLQSVYLEFYEKKRKQR